MNCTPTVADQGTLDESDLTTLYSAVGWDAYSANPESLSRAVANSDFVATARCRHGLVGLARAISDDVSIFYLQDILVSPDHRRAGIGKRLLERCLERYSHVRQKVLLTDDLPGQHAFYKSAGYVDTADLEQVQLHTFVQIRGIAE